MGINLDIAELIRWLTTKSVAEDEMLDSRDQGPIDAEWGSTYARRIARFRNSVEKTNPWVLILILLN
jgi:hypothetical protein